MKFDTKARLAHIAEIAEGKVETTRRFTDQIGELLPKKQRRNQQRAKVLESNMGRDAQKKELARLDGELADLTSEIQSLTDRRAKISAEWNEAGRLRDACIEFASENRLPFPETVVQPGMEWPSPEAM